MAEIPSPLPSPVPSPSPLPVPVPSPSPSSSQSKQKHVVFILVDDWGSFDTAWRQKELGYNATLLTPTLDRLASGGVKLDGYYTQHICSPTRTSLLSARYQIHTGLQDDIIQSLSRICLPPKFGTLGDAFQQLGYRTHAIGKWHAGMYKEECMPWRRGFDSYYGFLTGSELHYTRLVVCFHASNLRAAACMPTRLLYLHTAERPGGLCTPLHHGSVTPATGVSSPTSAPSVGQYCPIASRLHFSLLRRLRRRVGRAKARAPIARTRSQQGIFRQVSMCNRPKR